MTAFQMIAETTPNFETIEALGKSLTTVFMAAGAELVAPAIIQPAGLFLDVVGESLRGRTYVFTDPDGQELPWDGKVFGDLLVKGPWIIDDYYKSGNPPPLVGGWFPTGDVGTIDPDGYLQITDRSKDVIKSGGEWISSIDVENIAVSHPAVAMAACIGVVHPKWDERPIIAVVKKPGASVTREELLAFYEGKIAKWQVPDDVVFVDAIPLGGTGKMQKTKLREILKDYRLPGV